MRRKKQHALPVKCVHSLRPFAKSIYTNAFAEMVNSKLGRNLERINAKFTLNVDVIIIFFVYFLKNFFSNKSQKLSISSFSLFLMHILRNCIICMLVFVSAAFYHFISYILGGSLQPSISTCDLFKVQVMTLFIHTGINRSNLITVITMDLIVSDAKYIESFLALTVISASSMQNLHFNVFGDEPSIPKFKKKLYSRYVILFF